jgi:hypothetical protein
VRASFGESPYLLWKVINKRFALSAAVVAHWPVSSLLTMRPQGAHVLEMHLMSQPTHLFDVKSFNRQALQLLALRVTGRAPSPTAELEQEHLF